MQDPTLFTSFEWVLMAMAGLISLLLYAIFRRAEPGSPYAGRDESWSRNKSRSRTAPEGDAGQNRLEV